MNLQTHIHDTLNTLRSNNLYRTPCVYTAHAGAKVLLNGHEYIQMSGNNYLNLCHHPEIIQFIKEHIHQYGTGSSGSRLISGYLDIHQELETQLAQFKHKEASLVFNSGYVTNLSVISTLVDHHDSIYIDKLNHASIIDGARLSRAQLYVFKHKDYAHLKTLLETHAKKYRTNLIISDSVFSMDGDIANLPELVRLKKEHNATLMIDDAHGFGIFGSHGQGLCYESGCSQDIDIEVGTFSKALGLQGGFVSGSGELIDFLYQKARGFVYSTAISPVLVLGAIAGLNILKKNPELIQNLWNNSHFFKNRLTQIPSISMMNSQSAITPIIVGNTEQTIKFSQDLLETYRIIATAIRPPTVKTSRIRFCMNTAHSQENLLDVIQAIEILSQKLFS